MTHRPFIGPRTDRGGGTPAAGGLKPTMSTDTSQRQNGIDDVEYSYHHEPPDEGGQRFARCRACGAELLCSLGGANKMLHNPDCPASES